jgi:hypothetical protein
MTQRDYKAPLKIEHPSMRPRYVRSQATAIEAFRHLDLDSATLRPVKASNEQPVKLQRTSQGAVVIHRPHTSGPTA